MGGGLLQLVAYGAQDAYLSGNPQITFWRGPFKRHTNFAMEPFRVNLTGQAAWGTKHSAILGRHADLVSSAYIEVELQTDTGTLVYAAGGRRAAFNLIEYAELDIGGQIIDRQYGEFLYIWSQLAHRLEDQYNMDLMSRTINSTNGTCDGTTGRPFRNNITYIPLMFFFCRNPGAALPLIALQYHEVKINILWNKVRQIFTGGVSSTGPAQANLLIDYVYLDVEERRRMAQESHEYLIEQTQFNEDKGLTTAQNRIDLTFNHPVKELIWVTQYSWRRNCNITPPAPPPPAVPAPAVPVVYGVSPLTYDALIHDCSLQLNGQDRVPSLPGTYYAGVQPFQHHSGVGFVDGDNGFFGGPPLVYPSTDLRGMTGGVYIYSFAIKPEEHQPSGTCNFSRIDTATLVFSVDGKKVISNADVENAEIRVYAINYNILRVMSGMGGLAYSN
jgi:hypothetical protein